MTTGPVPTSVIFPRCSGKNKVEHSLVFFCCVGDDSAESFPVIGKSICMTRIDNKVGAARARRLVLFVMSENGLRDSVASTGLDEVIQNYSHLTHTSEMLITDGYADM